MGLFKKYHPKNRFGKKEIDEILNYSKSENKKFLWDVMNIKNIDFFEAKYIMSKLNLTEEKIKVLNAVMKKYEKKEELQKDPSGLFMFKIIRSLELMENGSKNINDEIKSCKRNVEEFNNFLEGIITHSSLLFDKKEQGYVFKNVY